MDKKLLHICHLPLDLGYFAAQDPQTRSNIREESARLIVAGVGDITTTTEKLILEWKMGASQLATGSNKNSLTRITIATVVSGDPVFAR